MNRPGASGTADNGPDGKGLADARRQEPSSAWRTLDDVVEPRAVTSAPHTYPGIDPRVFNAAPADAEANQNGMARSRAPEAPPDIDASWRSARVLIAVVGFLAGACVIALLLAPAR